MSSSSLPTRCCLCLRCRTALLAEEDCECAGAPNVACFAEREERAKIIEACWGDSDSRARASLAPQRSQRRLLLASVAGLTVGGLAAIGYAGLAPLATSFGAMLGSLGGGIVAHFGNIRGRPQPQGADTEPAVGARRLRGYIGGGHALVSPAGAHECLAYGIELWFVGPSRERVVYRDSVTSGFSVTLGSGEEVVVPAGRIRFFGPAHELLDVDNLELEAYLQEVDPFREGSNDLQPLSFNVVREHILFDGDEVEMLGEFVPKARSAGAGSLYRDRVDSYLRCVQTPQLRAISRA